LRQTERVVVASWLASDSRRVGVYHDLAADGKVENYRTGIAVVRTAGIQQDPLELRYVDPRGRETQHCTISLKANSLGLDITAVA
jgi:hypothetical protein